MTEPAVEVKARFEADEAKQQAKSFGDDLFGALVPTVDVASLVKDGLVAIKDTIVEVTKASIGAALESQEAQNKLGAQLKHVGDETGALLARTQAYNSALLGKIGLDDDDTAAMQTKLLALKVSKDDLEAATRATLGLADATGKDATRGAKEVAKAFAEGGEEAARLEAMFAVTESRAQGLAGQMRILGAQTSEAGEDLGMFFVQSEEFVKATRGAAENVELLRAKLQEHGSAVKEVADETGKFGQFLNALGTVAIEAGGPTVDYLANLANQQEPIRQIVQSFADWRDIIIDIGDELRQSELEKVRGAEFAERIKAIIAASEAETAADVDEEGGDGSKLKTGQIKKLFGVGKEGTRTGPARKVAEDPAIAEARERARAEADELAEQQKRVEKARKDGAERVRQADIARLEYEEQIAEARRERSDAQLRQQEHVAAVEADIQQKRTDQERSFWGSTVNTVTQGVGQYVAQLAVAAAAGKSVDLGEFFGRFLIQMGTSAVSMGTTAALAGALGTVAPWLAPVTGGPAGIVAGTALAAGGLAAILIGSQLGGSGEAPPTATAAPPSVGAAASGASGARAAGFATSGFNPDRSGAGGGGTTVINLNFGQRGVIVGSEREAGRTMIGMIREALTLRNDDAFGFEGVFR